MSCQLWSLRYEYGVYSNPLQEGEQKGCEIYRVQRHLRCGDRKASEKDQVMPFDEQAAAGLRTNSSIMVLLFFFREVKFWLDSRDGSVAPNDTQHEPDTTVDDTQISERLKSGYAATTGPLTKTRTPLKTTTCPLMKTGAPLKAAGGKLAAKKQC